MREQPILPRSEIYHLKKLAKGHVIFKKLYRIATNEPIIEESFGELVNGTFYQQTNETSLENRRNLNGKKCFRSTIILRDRRTLETYKNYT